MIICGINIGDDFIKIKQLIEYETNQPITNYLNLKHGYEHITAHNEKIIFFVISKVELIDRLKIESSYFNHAFNHKDFIMLFSENTVCINGS